MLRTGMPLFYGASHVLINETNAHLVSAGLQLLQQRLSACLRHRWTVLALLEQRLHPHVLNITVPNFRVCAPLKEYLSLQIPHSTNAACLSGEKIGLLRISGQ